MAGCTGGADGQGLRTVQDDGLRISRGMEGAGQLLETLSPKEIGLQREEHHQPLGTTRRERHGGIHPPRGEAFRVGHQREPGATLQRTLSGKDGAAHTGHDVCGERHQDGASGHGGPLARLRPGMAGQKVEWGIHRP